MDSESILEFIDSGHDLLIAIDSQVSEELRGLIGDWVEVGRGCREAPPFFFA